MAPRWTSDGAYLADTNSTDDATTSHSFASTSTLPRRHTPRMVKRSFTKRQFNNRPNSNNTNSRDDDDDDRGRDRDGDRQRNSFGCSQCNIRDNDPRVRYVGNWILNGTQRSTTHITSTIGSTVTLRFNGTGIIVFGTVPASNETVLPPSAVYLLDADPPFATSAPFAPASVPNQPMFASGQLAAGREHSLVINVTSAETPYILQRFFVFPRPPAQKDTIGQPPSGSSRGQNPAATATSPPTPSATSQTLNSNGPDPGAQQAVRALAAVLGTLAFLIIACIIIFLYLRFRRRRQLEAQLAADEKSTYGSQVGSRRSRRPETVYTTFTSTESILRNDSVWSPSHRSTRSHFSRGDGYRSEGRNTIDFTPPPLPPKPGRVSSPNTVGSGTT